MTRIVTSIVLLVSIIVGTSLQAQRINYSFDDCSFEATEGNGPQAVSEDLPGCQCAATDKGIYFDGGRANLEIPIDVDSLLTEAFTIDLYFRIERARGITDIFSIRNACALDSVVALKYDAESEKLLLELGRNVENYQLFTIDMDPNSCWNRFTLTKNGLLYSAYLNNDEVAEYIPPANIAYGRGAKFRLASSPCLTKNENPFRGWIDDISFYSRAISKQEIQANYLYPDRIISQDTTIVAGNEIEIKVGPTCSENVDWTTTATYQVTEGNNIATSPQQSSLYKMRIVHQPRCITYDSIRINVIDADKKDCNNLALPKAFTPNGDRLNDTYGIDSKYLIDEVKSFEIYDRNGAVLWTGTNKDERWDGFVQGTPLNNGMYLYRLIYTCDDKEYSKVDNFALLR